METENNIIKPSFDGRQYFYKLLGSYQENIAECRYYNNYVGWEKSLIGMLSMVSPYIKNSDRIRQSLELLKPFLDKKFSGSFKNHIEKELNKITFDLFQESKYMMLPFSEDDNGEFDLDTFMKESDL